MFKKTHRNAYMLAAGVVQRIDDRWYGDNDGDPEKLSSRAKRHVGFCDVPRSREALCCLFVHTTKTQGPSAAPDFRFATNRASLGMTRWGRITDRLRELHVRVGRDDERLPKKLSSRAKRHVAFCDVPRSRETLCCLCALGSRSWSAIRKSAIWLPT